MLSRILAFRPASVVSRLAPRSGACPLSARELLGPAAELGFVLPIVEAPFSGVARGALVAAKQLRAAVALALPPGVPAGPWVERVTRAADDVAAGLPICLCAEVIVEGEGPTQLERANAAAWALVDAGVTHLAVDVGAIAAAERGRIISDIARTGAERGASIEAVIPLGDGAHAPARAVAMLDDAARRGAAPDAAGFRCPAPADEGEARAQAASLARVARALGGAPVVRRGGAPGALRALLPGSPVKACYDDGAASRAMALLPRLAARDGGGPERESQLERAAAELPPAEADRVEARAYADALELIEALGAAGSALSVGRALERRLDER